MEIEKARIGQDVAAECRAEAFEEIKPKRGTLYAEILEVLDGKQLTAKEIAEEMCRRGHISKGERQNVAPRLSEMTNEKGWTKIVGKRKCPDKGVSVYERVI